MDSARYLLVFGVILALLCGIVPVSGYEETFSLSVLEGATSETTVMDAAWKNVNAFWVSPGMITVNWDGFNSYTPSYKIDNYASLGQSDNWKVTLHERQAVVNNPYGAIMGNATFGYFKYGSGDGTHLCMYLDVHDIDKSRLSTDDYTIVMIKHQDGKTVPNLRQRGTTSKDYGTYLDEMDISHTGYLLCWGDYYCKASSPYDSYCVAGLETIHYYLLESEWSNKIIVDEITTGFQKMDIQIIKDEGDIYGFSTSVVAFQDTNLIKTDVNNWNYTLLPDQYPVTVSIHEIVTDTWYNRTFGLPPAPTPTPIPEPELTYIAKIEARDYHTNQILPDVHFLVVDFKKSETLYNEWVSAGFIEIPLEYRSYDDSHFPKQYGIRASKQGYYADDIIVSHWIKPYTFIIRMRDIYSEEPLDTSLITFHIRDRFSNNYIDTARLIITHYDKGEVFNQTVNGGIQSVRLPQTQPYDPQFDYNATVKADNYDDTVMGFSVYNDVDINIKMFPGEGTPGEGNAFIHFTVGYFDNNDIFRNIPGAKITIGAQSMYTNAAGYAQFELPDDNFYTYTAEHFEFETVSGSIMLQGSRTHNIIMHRHEVPTTPTAQPTFPGEEPADESYLDWMARNFARAFNLSLEGGKLFMGMIISLAIGMITAKKLNGGAAEFGIGMLGGMVLCILIGILPIWPIIALLLIVGLYIGMHIARGYTHGGR